MSLFKNHQNIISLPTSEMTSYFFDEYNKNTYKYITPCSKVWGPYNFSKEMNTFLFIKDTLNWYKVTVFVVFAILQNIYISYKCFSFLTLYSSTNHEKINHCLQLNLFFFWKLFNIFNNRNITGINCILNTLNYKRYFKLQ